MNLVLLLTQLLPLPFVWTGAVGFADLAFAYSLEAGVLGLVHAGRLWRSGDRGWHWAVATSTPFVAMLLAFTFVAGDSRVQVELGVAATTAAALLGGVAVVAWREGLPAAIGSPGTMTWRLGPVFGAFCAAYWLEATLVLQAEHGSPVAGTSGAWGAAARGLVDLADALAQPVSALLALLLVAWRAVNEVLTEAWERSPVPRQTDAVSV